MSMVLIIIAFAEMVVFLFIARSYHSLPQGAQLLVVPGLAISIIDLYMMIVKGTSVHAYVAIVAQACILAATACVRKHSLR